jgi:hypothetical protein
MKPLRNGAVWMVVLLAEVGLSMIEVVNVNGKWLLRDNRKCKAAGTRNGAAGT